MGGNEEGGSEASGSEIDGDESRLSLELALCFGDIVRTGRRVGSRHFESYRTL